MCSFVLVRGIEGKIKQQRNHEDANLLNEFFKLELVLFFIFLP